MTTTQRYDALIDAGFDRSRCEERDEFGRFSKAIYVRCSQCEALCINGVPCHEIGCPNGRRANDNDEFEED
jgi:hypothetical protein